MRKNKSDAKVNQVSRFREMKIGIHNGDWIKNTILCAAPLVFMILFHLLKINDEPNVKMFMKLSLMAVAGYGGYLAYRGKLDASKAVTLIIIAGVIMRTGYTIYTHAFTRAHDIGANDPTGVGHWGYLYRVLNGRLPESNEYQFYQPPLFYAISAVFVKAAMIVTGGNDLNGYMYMSQLVSCMASCVMLVTLSEIMDELKISKRVQIIPVALTAFYPAQIFAAGRMNNDALVFMFMILALYFTLKWNREQKLKYIIGIAATIGCGMMTKINGALIAFVAGPIMIYHFVKRIKSKDKTQIKDIIIQFAVFAVIVFPLGLWYPIRNYIMFGQKFTYVPLAGESADIYTGNESFFSRWIDIPFAKFIEKPYMDMGADNSIWMSLIKTGVHGEFTWGDEYPKILMWLIEYVHAVVMMIAIVSVAFTAFKDKFLKPMQKYSLLAIWILAAISYISFNVSHPAMCTADFRYAILGQIAAAVIIGYFTDYCYRNREKRLYRIIFGADIAVVLLFCALSIIQLA